MVTGISSASTNHSYSSSSSACVFWKKKVIVILLFWRIPSSFVYYLFLILCCCCHWLDAPSFIICQMLMLLKMWYIFIIQILMCMELYGDIYSTNLNTMPNVTNFCLRSYEANWLFNILLFLNIRVDRALKYEHFGI